MSLHSDVMHTTPAWLLKTPEATRFVREHEHAYPRPFHQYGDVTTVMHTIQDL